MTLNIVLDDSALVRSISGVAKVSDIKKYGLIEASRRRGLE